MSNQPSGSKKRKRKAAIEQSNKKLSLSMMNFITKNEGDKAVKESSKSSLNIDENSGSTSNVEENSTSARSTSNIEENYTLSSNGEENYTLTSNFEENYRSASNIENSRSLSEDSTDIYNSQLIRSSPKIVEQNVDFTLSEIVSISHEYDYSDPALWPSPITDALREHFLHNEANQNVNFLQNSKKVFGKHERMCHETNFFRKKKNGEAVKRDWLVYSPSCKAVFCYICKLYGSNQFNSSDQALCIDGYSDWRNIAKRLSSHENSQFHRKSVYSFSQRSVTANRIDNNLVKQYKSECEYWKKILCRVVSVIKFIAQRGLACFGDNETFGSLQNGNFLGLIELLSSFDPFLAEHIKSTGNKGKGHVNYLSSTIVTELIDVMSNKVFQEIVSEVKEAKYFGIIVDSTPDICHADQLAIVLRYVDKEGECVERFLKFIAIHGHSSQHLHEVISNFLESAQIQLKYCRGQSFDNASNMSGKYSGLQARLKKDFPLIDYVPCSAHSLNLVGTSAVECCNQAVSFFGLVQTLYNFFAVSTHRWELLTTNLITKCRNLTLKSLSGTRWSANADAVKALRKNFSSILNTLSLLSNSDNESAATRHEAGSLFRKLKLFESALMTVIWDSILQRIDSVSKTVQSVDCEMTAILPLYSSLIDFVKNVRNKFSEYEKEAEVLVDTNEYAVSRSKKTAKSKMLDESSSTAVAFTERERFLYQVHYVICDSIISELDKRKSAYAFLDSRFGFMYNKNMAENIIQESAKAFQNTYSDDLEEEFMDEFLQFNNFTGHLTLADKLKMIKSLNIGHTFPNVETALRIILSIPLTNCSSERSFSALKRIKNRLRSSLSQRKLSGLALLAIESDITNRLNFDEIIEDFANWKARRKPM